MTSDTSTPSAPAPTRREAARPDQKSRSALPRPVRRGRSAREAPANPRGGFRRAGPARAATEAEKGKEAAAAGLDDFAAAVRKASDELGSRDQSMASHLVREVAGGLEQASRTIHGKDIGEFTQSVAVCAGTARDIPGRRGPCRAGARPFRPFVGRAPRNGLSERRAVRLPPRNRDGRARAGAGPRQRSAGASLSRQRPGTNATGGRHVS